MPSTGATRWIKAVSLATVLLAPGCSRSSPTAAPEAAPPAPSGATPPAASPSPSPAPSAPPAGPASLIAEVRVAFFGIRCNPGQKPPGNTQKVLPLGCTGVVSATPKMADGSDLPQDTPGLEIAWTLVPEGKVIVRVTDFPGQPFNKNVVPRRIGPFALCAVVNGVQGCLNGQVVG